MTNAELLAKIKAEIERLCDEAPTCDDTIAYLMKVECFLDTLESGKPVPNDLEEYASRAGFDYVDNIVQEHPGHRFNDHDVEFAYRDGIIAGAKWQAKQMMKEAEECELYWDGDFLAIDLNMAALGYSERDKVRVIVLPKEN